MIGKTNKMNRSKLLAATMAAVMVFAAVAIITSDDSADAAAKAEQAWSGNLKDAYQPFPANTNVVLNADTTIGQNGVLYIEGSFRVAEGVTLTIVDGGKVVVNSEKGEVVIEGDVVIKGKGKEVITNDGTETASETGNTKVYNSNVSKLPDGIRDKVADSNSEMYINNDASIEIEGNVQVTKEGKIGASESKTAIEENGDNTEATPKKGTASVSKGGVLKVENKGLISNLDVEVAVGGTFVYAGITQNDMKVSASGNGDNRVWTSATISQTKSDSKEYSNMTFTVTSSSYNAYSVAENPVKTVFKDYALNITGTLAGGETVTFERNIFMKGTNGENAYNYEGPQNLFYKDKDTAEGAYDAKTGSDGSYTYNYISAEPGSIVLGQVIIDRLNVGDGSSLYNGVDDDRTKKETPTTLNVMGGLKFAEDSNQDQVRNDGLIIVAGELVLNKDGLVKYSGLGYTEFGSIYVDGGKVTVRETSDIIEFVFNGVAYYDGKNMIIISDLQAAIDGAVAAKNSEVFISGSFKSGLKDANSQIDNTEKGRSYAGSFVIDKDITIPDGMTLNVNNGVVIEDGVTLTVSKKAILESTDDSIVNINVLGKLVDLSLDDDILEMLKFQVRSTDADETQYTYCSLKTALAETTEGTITLYDDIGMEENLTIPAGVTVEFEDEGIRDLAYTFIVGADDKKATLTIDGILNLGSKNILAVDEEGKVVVNNLIRYEGVQTIQITGDVPGAYLTAEILEDDDTDTNYIASVAVAAQNSAKTEEITIKGGLSFGDVTFTKGEDANDLKVYIVNSYDGKDSKGLAAGNITLIGATLDMIQGYFTGSVQTDVTSGTSVISFEKSKGAIVGIDTTDIVGGSETSAIIYGNGAVHVYGKVTIASGTVVVKSGTELKMVQDMGAAEIGVLAVASGATLDVPEKATLTLADPVNKDGDLRFTTGSLGDYIAKNTTFALDGILNVAGTVQWGVTVINGGMNVLKGGVTSLSIVENNGTIAVGSDASEAKVEIMSLAGKVSGKLAIGDYSGGVAGFIIAYAGSDIAGMDLGDNVKKSELVLNIDVAVGADVFATVFTNSDGFGFAKVMEYIDVKNYYVDEINKTKAFYSDADFTTLISSGNQNVGYVETVYVKMVAKDVVGKISAVSGMNIFIDNLDIENFWDGKTYKLSVGTHTVTVQVQPGYEATPVITFNGQTVTDGKIVIEAGMEDFVLTATGDVTVDGGNGGSDDGMGITDYLLIILVVMVVILAIVVIMRMMRS